ncbi:hypothetical protein OPIT5_27755 [Opitutaceae bacterium TAV5]|nr:hypothetical protein OPIT5_27755 [Opitutaceae bacterium TAV5]
MEGSMRIRIFAPLRGHSCSSGRLLATFTRSPFSAIRLHKEIK